MLATIHTCGSLNKPEPATIAMPRTIVKPSRKVPYSLALAAASRSRDGEGRFICSVDEWSVRVARSAPKYQALLIMRNIALSRFFRCRREVLELIQSAKLRLLTRPARTMSIVRENICVMVAQIPFQFALRRPDLPHRMPASPILVAYGLDTFVFQKA